MVSVMTASAFINKITDLVNNINVASSSSNSSNSICSCPGQQQTTDDIDINIETTRTRSNGMSNTPTASSKHNVTTIICNDMIQSQNDTDKDNDKTNNDKTNNDDIDEEPIELEHGSIDNNNLNNLTVISTLENHFHSDDILNNSIERRPTLSKTVSNARSLRYNTSISQTIISNDNDNDDNDDDDEDKINESNMLSEYGFGVGFSYYKEWPYYPYIDAKYKDLKEELLNNKVASVSLNEYHKIYSKGCQKETKIESILLENAFAANDPFWNNLFGISANSKISLQHLLSILFYTDLTDLPKQMKNACRKLKMNETIDDVKLRHCNLVNWLKLLFETIVLFGNKYNTKSKPIYHGLDIKFNFSDFKAGFRIPTSTTTELSVARGFAGDNGITLQFIGFEVEERYFNTEHLSAFPEEKEYLFFYAELNINAIIVKTLKFNMAPLSLYESIINGCNIVEKVQLKKDQFKKTQQILNRYLTNIRKDEEENENERDDEKKDDAQKYGINLLKNYRKKCKNIYINPDILINKITFPKLREKFINSNNKEFDGYSDYLITKQSKQEVELNKGYYFKWIIERDEINEWKNHWEDDEDEDEGDDDDDDDAGSPLSEGFECDDETIFYAQMDYLDGVGRITLFLYELQDDKKNKLNNVSFDIYCKKLSKYYTRLENINFDISEEGMEDGKHYQGESFDIKLLDKALNKYEQIEWEFTIRYTE